MKTYSFTYNLRDVLSLKELLDCGNNIGTAVHILIENGTISPKDTAEILEFWVNKAEKLRFEEIEQRNKKLEFLIKVGHVN